MAEQAGARPAAAPGLLGGSEHAGEHGTSPEPAAVVAAEHAARTRLLNAYLRETGVHDVAPGELLVRLPATGRTLRAEVRHRSPCGHHRYAEHTTPGHAEFVAALLAELEATTGCAGAAELAAQIGNSVSRTARYLGHGRRQPGTGAHALTRHAEQNVLLGHPFHPTPKSAEGFTDADLGRYSPELGAEFVPYYLAVASEVVVDVRVAPGDWVPDEVAAQIPPGYEALPVHPWQAGYLRGLPEVTALIEQGALVPLGPLGRPVYPTSSVRTVCDPEFPVSWKLPLHVRITNFVRNNPLEHLRRAADASLLAARLPALDGFGVVLESGYRTLDPRVVSDGLAADLAVLFRRNPFARNGQAPRVLAGWLEDPPRIEGPAEEWLRRYLDVSLLPLLSAFASDGVSFEAHVQNSLLCTQDGRPTGFWVRDLEGVSASRTRARHELVAPDSPVLYDEDEAWLRLRYHAVTNQLGHVVHVLGLHTGAGEDRLWRVAREHLTGRPEAGDLLACPTLPAKANLFSRFTGRGERPHYVDVPNPLRELP
ncbi:hypothetical protein DI005_36670 [Prauserella sp. PE36]|uniref:IucA/IucC family protein n=1 Tax=Prauserella sp. PE36 TaxID=1504709 RepID=UPI000D9416E6|nr:IucA/IucC family protein [Prauserella sp. PE36]PXY37199.1 hypothetical protein BAY59_01040 [Prauserella coralliicola]RBM10150.1 hypothetical protein DI005_36670 [Prauserella sp. PE36]